MNKKTPSTLDELNQMIEDKVIEDWELDYKRAIADKTKAVEEIAKDVSSFANSDGGVLIYGIAEDGDKHFPEKIEPINFRVISKEWIESCIDKISPKITGCRITPIYVNEADRTGCYVVWVQKSLTVHQAPDCKYYKRGNFKAEPMRHYEVMDVFGRSALPRISLKIRLEIGPQNGVHFRCILTNEGTRLIKHWKMELEIPGAIHFGANRIDVINFNSSNVSHATILAYDPIEARYIHAHYLDNTVIFPQEVRGVVFSFGSQNQIIPGHSFGPGRLAEVTVYADNMPCFYAEVLISSLVSDSAIDIIPVV